MAGHRTRGVLFVGVIASVMAIVVSACSPAATTAELSTTSSVTTTVLSTTTQTSATTTTTTAATTTTTVPRRSVSVAGDVPEGLIPPVASFLTAAANGDALAKGVAEGLLESVGDVADGIAGTYTVTASTSDLVIGGSVGVIRLDTGDALLVADDGQGWEVVGADLASLGVPPWFGPSPRRVLVLGSDARPGGDPAVHRMDSIHILTAVPANGRGTILGYPRDSYVTTPYGEMRINALTTSGRGPDALYTFYTDTWDIPLDGYILTAFSGFEKLVASTIGRLTITIPRALPVQEWWPGFSSGTQTLSPTRTLDYARTRKRIPGGDFTRSANQGVVMLATLAMLQQGSVDDAPALLAELAKYTETNLAPSDLIQLAAAAYALDIAEVDNTVLPGHLGRGAGGASVVFLEPAADGIVDDVVVDGILDGMNE